MLINLRRNTGLIGILAVCIFILCESIPFHNGISLWDEGHYTNLAIRLAEGSGISFSEGVCANRFATYAIAAGFIKVFGFNEHITWAFSFIFALLIVGIWFCLKQNKRVAFFAVFLLGTSPILIQESSRVMSDVIGGITASGAILIYFLYGNGKKKGWHWGVLAGVVFCLSVLTRESFLFLLPAMVVIAFTSREKEFWIITAATVFVGGLLLIAGYWLNGDLLVRFHMLYSGHITESNGYAFASTYEKVKRVTYQPFQFLVENYSFGILLLLAPLNFLGEGRREEKNIVRPFLLVTLAVFWFCPESFHLNPVPLVPRLWIPLLIPLAVNAAFGLDKVEAFSVKDKWRATIFIICFLLGSIGVLYISKKEHQARGIPDFSSLLQIVYLVICGLLIAGIWIKCKMKALILTAIVAMSQITALFAGRVIGVSGKSALVYPVEKDALFKLARIAKQDDYVLTDPALASDFVIYGNLPKELCFLNFYWVQPDTLKQQHRDVFLYLNSERMKIITNSINETRVYTLANNPILPQYVQEPEMLFKLLDSTGTYKLFVAK